MLLSNKRTTDFKKTVRRTVARLFSSDTSSKEMADDNDLGFIAPDRAHDFSFSVIV